MRKAPKAPKVPEFSSFSGKSVGGIRHFSKGDFTRFYHVSAYGGLHRKAFPCVCGGKRYLYPATPRGRVSIYTDIDGRPGGFLRNSESAESAGIFAILGEIPRGGGGAGAFLRGILPVFYHVSA